MFNRNESSPSRSAGVLLHPTSLPGPHGIGDLGPSAYAWIDWLVRARQTWWQVLPLGPTGYGDSPYQSFSAFAGNTNLLSPELLFQEGLLDRASLEGQQSSEGDIDYGSVIASKRALLGRAWAAFSAGRARGLAAEFEAFAAGNRAWLDDFSLFMAVKEAHGGAAWQRWAHGLARREPGALADARREFADAIGVQRFGQFLFFRQWRAVRDYAHGQGIRLIGDLPIFVAEDSADVWAHPDLFQLDPAGRPRVIAGVPPDGFSATGQRWGNPLYDWSALARTGYRWWVERVRAALEQVDLIRLDHFRGFEAYFEIPAGMPTAEHGRWVPGPGADLLGVLERELGRLPLIAEDLGVITPPVEALRKQFRWPGMRILQFAFGGPVEDRFLPHNHEQDTVVYTGTHDNDTTVGWYQKLEPQEKAFLRSYLPGAEQDVAWSLIRTAHASVGELAVVPMQDVLRLGTESRMNHPGRPEGNWRWRLRPGVATAERAAELASLTALYQRAAPAGEQGEKQKKASL